MGRLRVFLILLLSLAILPAAIVARAAPGLPASLHMHTASADGAKDTLMKRKGPCSRSMLPNAPCVASFSLPPDGAGDARPVDASNAQMVLAERPLPGLPPSCILGPPRSC